MRASGYLVLFCIALSGVAADLTIAPAAPEVGPAVRAILSKHCIDCHSQADQQDPVLDETVSLASLRGNEKAVIAGNPAASKLFSLVSLDPTDKQRMPKSTRDEPRAPLSVEEKAVLERWIRGDATGPDRPHFAEADVMRAILSDLEGHPPADRVNFRYLSLHNLHNQPIRLVSESDLATHRAAISKLINSLSWQPVIAKPEPIDAARLVYRLDLRDYGWDADMWRLVLSHNPYGFINTELEAQLAASAGTSDLLWVRADWFIFACAQPPLYDQLLYPAKIVPGLQKETHLAERHLEAHLGVKPLENLRATATRSKQLPVDFFPGREAPLDRLVIRAGFLKSGVSIAGNRLIERHALPNGRAYWKSYDFGRSEPGSQSSLVHYPLGPVRAGLSRDDRLAFRHDGGELIFHLPNGLQGYLLVDSQGRMLARAPERIVQDRSAEDRTIINGISCIKCHSDGLNDPPGGLRDDIRPGVLATIGGRISAGDIRAIENLHPVDSDLGRQAEADRALFRRALHEAGADGLAQEPVSQAHLFFQRNISEDSLAAELDLDRSRLPRSLRETMAQSTNEEVRSIATLLSAGIKRAELIPRLRLIASALFRLEMHRPLRPLLPLSDEGRRVQAIAKEVERRKKINPEGDGGNGAPKSESLASVSTPVMRMSAPGSEEKKPPNPSFENSLGMKFVKIPNTDVWFCIWETRRKDFAQFVRETAYTTQGFMLSLGPVFLGTRPGSHPEGYSYKLGRSWENPGFTQTDDHPVCGVSYLDAQAFCRWLTAKEDKLNRLGLGQYYRLPTDLEWSQAAGLLREKGATPQERDGSLKDVYHWGRTFPPPNGAANYSGPESKMGREPDDWPTIAGFHDPYERTAPVGSFPVNSLGLFDLFGNVAEWCEDTVDVGDSKRVQRGGSWASSEPRDLLPSSRRAGHPAIGEDIVGFRCVLDDGFLTYSLSPPDLPSTDEPKPHARGPTQVKIFVQE